MPGKLGSRSRRRAECQFMSHATSRHEIRNACQMLVARHRPRWQHGSSINHGANAGTGGCLSDYFPSVRYVAFSAPACLLLLVYLLCVAFSAPACLSALSAPACLLQLVYLLPFPSVLGYPVTFPLCLAASPPTHSSTSILEYLYSHHAPRFLSTSVPVFDYASVWY